MAAPNGGFDLYGELFHVFISYRVATEGSEAPGNCLARRLYDELHALSRDVAGGLSIPFEGWGQYPRCAKEPPENMRDNQAKVSVSLTEWRQGIIRVKRLRLVPL